MPDIDRVRARGADGTDAEEQSDDGMGPIRDRTRAPTTHASDGTLAEAGAHSAPKLERSKAEAMNTADR